MATSSNQLPPPAADSEAAFYTNLGYGDFVHATPPEVQDLLDLKNQLQKQLDDLKVQNIGLVGQYQDETDTLKAQNATQIQGLGDRIEELEQQNAELSKEVGELQRQLADETNQTITSVQKDLATVNMRIFRVLYPIYCRNYFTYNFIKDKKINFDLLNDNGLFTRVERLLAPRIREQGTNSDMEIDQTAGNESRDTDPWTEEMRRRIKNDCSLAALIYDWVILKKYRYPRTALPPTKEFVADVARIYFQSVKGVIANVLLPLSMALAIDWYRSFTASSAVDFYPTLDLYEYTFFSYSGSNEEVAIPNGFAKDAPHIFDSGSVQ